MNDLPAVDGLPSRLAGRRGLVLCCAVAVAAALGLAGFGAGARPLAQVVALAALAGLAAVGAFSLMTGGRETAKAPTQPGDGLEFLASFGAGLEDGLLLALPDGTIAFANAAFWRLLGHRGGFPAEFKPAAVLSRLHGSGEAVYRLTLAAASGEDWQEVLEQPAPGGGLGASRWLRISLERRSTSAGLAYSAWRIGDVTLEHTRQTESTQRLRRSLDQLDLLPAGLFVCGVDGRISYLNATLADWLGIDRLAADTGALTLERLLSADGPAAISAALSAASKGDVTALDVELQRPDGVRVPARLMARARPGAHQLDLGLVVIRVPGDRLEDGAQAAEARFTRLFRAAPIAIATIDSSGRIASANPALTRMFFASSGGGAVSGLDLLERLSEDSRARVRAALAAAGRGERPAQPIEIAFGDSTRRTGQLFLSANAAAGPERDSVILYALDTTERKDLEAQFAQSQKMQAIGQLAGGIAHDINNVLTVIIGFSDLLLANSAGDPAFHDLNEIKANANRAANLVRQLLAFSRRQTLRPEILSLNEVISDLSVFLKRSLGEKVKLERDYGRDLWLVKADQTELGRVFVNLAVNAVDAMPSGGTLTIRTANVSREDTVGLALPGFAPADYVLCSITDTGHGMTSDIIEKIFEPFFTTKDVGKGTGLGLSTVYGIVKQTGGYIYCESTPGQGTEFRIYLPRHLAGAGSAEVVIRPDRKEKPRDLTGTGTVLLVEDEDSVRRFAARALRRQGYTVLEAGNGHEALEIKAAHDGTIDLVVSDIVMPEMDGPSLLKELRKTNPELKIIFMSGYADDALSSLASGEEFAFLSKPFQLTDLVTAVKELMPQ